MTEDQQDQLVISLDTQYAVAHDGREPWRLIAKDAITEMLASPEIGGTA